MANWTSGPLLGLDLETTGRDPLVALPVQFALLHYQAGVVKGRHGLVNPGIPIPQETTEIHGITDYDVQERGGDLEKTIIGLAGELFVADSSGIPIVGMFVSYDLTVIDQCYRRLNGGKGLRDDGWNGKVIDISVMDKSLDKWRKGGRKLVDLCEHYKVPLENAHDARADTQAAVLVALAIAKKYPQVAKMDLELLHVQQAAWKRNWLKEYNVYLAEKKNEEPLPLSAGNWPLATDEAVSV